MIVVNQVLRDSEWTKIYWTEVKVGDIVKVRNEKFFPADLLLLSSRCLCVHTRTYTHVRTHTHTHTHSSHMHTHTHTCKHTCIARTHRLAHVHLIMFSYSIIVNLRVTVILKHQIWMGRLILKFDRYNFTRIRM